MSDFDQVSSAGLCVCVMSVQCGIMETPADSCMSDTLNCLQWLKPTHSHGHAPEI